MSELTEEAERAASERRRRVALAREAIDRADAMGADAMGSDARDPGDWAPATLRSGELGDLPRYPRWGWRRGVRFAVENRMLGPEHLALYGRYAWHRLRHPEVGFQGMAFVGRDVEFLARRGYGRLIIGPWCWIGNGNSLRAHEGSVRLGEKVVLGSNNVINGYLDIEIGADALLSDWIYVCDFDHHYSDLARPIRKQGLRKSPVRIGEDVWVGEKASVLRGADIGAGSVIGSQTVVKGRIPPFSIAVGAPARVIGSRLPRGMTPEEAIELRRTGRPIPRDPLTS